VLCAENLSFHAGKRALLLDVSLELRAGEVLALAGENGAGKTTLLKLLAGELEPSAGAVSLNGRPLVRWSPRERARVRAVLAQDGNIAFGFSAMETVLLGRFPHSGGGAGLADQVIARQALESLDAAHLAGRIVQTLSGGERARVMMARALAQIWGGAGDGPRYLLLDEPVASLDLAHQHMALRVAREWALERGIGVLAVLHDLNHAAQYADRIAILQQGRLAAIGTPEEVLTETLIAECFAIRSIVMRHPRADCILVVPSPEAAA
jgi:iron complex transport system ATP-binding protein